MKLLSIDTSTPSCSVGITDDEQLLSEATCVNGETHAKHIMRMIDTALEMAGLGISQIDGLAVIVGPGSFTGLRIGISTVKGLALALEKPVIGVSSLDALAHQALSPPRLICPVLDARRREVYYAVYIHDETKIKQVVPEGVSPPEAVVEKIAEPCQFLGNGARVYKSLFLEKLGTKAQFAPQCMHEVRAETISKLAMVKFQESGAIRSEALSPRYMRKSDAEINTMQP